MQNSSDMFQLSLIFFKSFKLYDLYHMYIYVIFENPMFVCVNNGTIPLVYRRFFIFMCSKSQQLFFSKFTLFKKYGFNLETLFEFLRKYACILCKNSGRKKIHCLQWAKNTNPYYIKESQIHKKIIVLHFLNFINFLKGDHSRFLQKTNRKLKKYRHYSAIFPCTGCGRVIITNSGVEVLDLSVFIYRFNCQCHTLYIAINFKNILYSTKMLICRCILKICVPVLCN